MNKVKITWKLDMFGRVIFVCDANTSIIDSVPALKNSYAAFKLLVAADNTLAQQLPQEDEGNGYAEHRNQVWKALAQSLDSMCGGLRSYAKKSKNIELLTQAKFSPGRFVKKRGTEAILLAKSKLTLLTAQMANLADYNVTPAKLTAATALTAELDLLNPKPTAQRSVDKALRKRVTQQIKETTALLKDEVDTLMLTLKADHPGFVEQYFNARRIVKTGIHHEKTEEEIADAKEAAKAKKLKKAAEAAQKKAEAEAAKKLAEAKQTEEGNPAAEGGQPDTNGLQPPNESGSNDGLTTTGFNT